MSTYIPNSFQTPNIIVDEIMEDITGNELKLLLFTIRHTYGWQDNLSHTKRISLSMYENGIPTKTDTHLGGVGISRPTIVSGLKSLVKKGYLIVEDEANSDGRLWSVNYEKGGKKLLLVDEGDGKKTLPVGSKESLPLGSKESLPKQTQGQTQPNTTSLSPEGDIPLFLKSKSGATLHSNHKGKPLCNTPGHAFIGVNEGEVTCKNCLKKMGLLEVERDPILDWIALKLCDAPDLETFQGWGYAGVLKSQIVKVHKSYPNAVEPTVKHLDKFEEWYRTEKYEGAELSLPRKENTLYIEYNDYFGTMRKRGNGNENDKQTSPSGDLSAYRNKQKAWEKTE